MPNVIPLVLTCFRCSLQVLRPGLIKGPWMPEEDATILRCLADGIVKWSDIADRIPGRVGKQCRERYFNHLDPAINKAAWALEEDCALEREQARLGEHSTARYAPCPMDNEHTTHRIRLLQVTDGVRLPSVCLAVLRMLLKTGGTVPCVVVPTASSWPWPRLRLGALPCRWHRQGIP